MAKKVGEKPVTEIIETTLQKKLWLGAGWKPGEKTPKPGPALGRNVWKEWNTYKDHKNIIITVSNY